MNSFGYTASQYVNNICLLNSSVLSVLIAIIVYLFLMFADGWSLEQLYGMK